MTHPILMPDLGQTVSEAKILKWLKRAGDAVKRGEALLEVETDKVTMEVEAYQDGYLREILAGEGQIASAMTAIGILTDEANEMYERPASIPAIPGPPLPDSISTSAASAVGQQMLASPAARSPAHEIAGPFELAMTESLLPNDLKLAMYRRMLLCRRFEERIYYMFLQGRLPGTIHQSQGQEACAVGVCFALQEKDLITSTHRPHSHAIARGVSVNSLMAELFAKKTGCCQGKGGSMHVGDPEAGMLPAIAIVGGGIPIAAGCALAFQYLREPRITACFFGEGAANTGIFHEALNMAAIWDLPVVFICENNRYGASTAVEKVMKVAKVSDRAAAYGLPGETLDGNDVEEVYRRTARAAAQARAGQGPTLLELETYRFSGHSRSDPGHYRPPEEVTAWKEKDPIVRYSRALEAAGILPPETKAEIESAVERQLDDAVAFAEHSPSPLPEDSLKDVFVE